jgi:hypothetical protein
MLAFGQRNKVVTSRFRIDALLHVQGSRSCTILNGEEPTWPPGSRRYAYSKTGYFSKLAASSVLENFQVACYLFINTYQGKSYIKIIVLRH